MDKEKTITVFQLNTFLLPGWVTYSSSSNNPLCVKQDFRAKEIGKIAKEFDLIFLQEMWGSNASLVEAELTSHVIPPEHQSVSVFTIKHTIFDVLKNYLNATGESITKSKKGMEASLFSTSESWGPDTYLLVINLHLDPFGEKIPKQMDQLVHYLHRLLTIFESKFKTIEFSKMGILILGDWNIGNKHPYYEYLISLFNQNIRELSDKDYKPTFDSTKNSYIPKEWQQTQKLDHMFVVDQLLHKKESIKFLTLEATQVNVLAQDYGQEWSDHWAQTASIRPVK